MIFSTLQGKNHCSSQIYSLFEMLVCNQVRKSSKLIQTNFGHTMSKDSLGKYHKARSSRLKGAIFLNLKNYYKNVVGNDNSFE